VPSVAPKIWNSEATATNTDHARADEIIQELKRDPLIEAFRLLTLEGDNWYDAGEFDRAVEPYEQTLAINPDDVDALNIFRRETKKRSNTVASW